MSLLHLCSLNDSVRTIVFCCKFAWIQNPVNFVIIVIQYQDRQSCPGPLFTFGLSMNFKSILEKMDISNLFSMIYEDNIWRRILTTAENNYIFDTRPKKQLYFSSIGRIWTVSKVYIKDFPIRLLAIIVNSRIWTFKGDSVQE